MSKSHNTNRATIILRPSVQRTDISKQDVKLIAEEKRYHVKMKTNKLEKRKEAEFKEEESKSGENKTETVNVLKKDITSENKTLEEKNDKNEAEELKESYEMENRKAVDGTADDINNLGGHLNKRTTF
ncbi:MAG: hypothetical protein UZ05_CHB002001333 [Chlorobi bacterium OLB5]|nr:MAG: hypothetical protein UZ05_CHB002001333 [Chlorobi bacterium OLB5]